MVDGCNVMGLVARGGESMWEVGFLKSTMIQSDLNRTVVYLCTLKEPNANALIANLV